MPKDFESWRTSGNEIAVALGLDNINEEFAGESYFLFSEMWRIAQELALQDNDNA